MTRVRDVQQDGAEGVFEVAREGGWIRLVVHGCCTWRRGTVVHGEEAQLYMAKRLLVVSIAMSVGVCINMCVCCTWRRGTGSLIFTGHFPSKSPIISGSFTKNNLQLKASYRSLPPCSTHIYTCSDDYLSS